MKRQGANILSYFSKTKRIELECEEEPDSDSHLETRQIVGCQPAWKVSEFVLIVNAHAYSDIFVYSCRSQSAANYPCTAECCRNSTSPYQPCDQAVIVSTRQQRQVGKKTETRVLNTNWYKDFRWIHVCET